uniref:Uncharacterized protein n=1 Tax=Alexandrium catenella TaxID=2925 RepID=A0A7S1RWX5_ALECA
MAYIDGASETTRAILRRSPLHIRRPQADRPPDWRCDERQVGSNSAYGAWSQVGGVASQHLSDLRRARNFMQFGLATTSREAARPRTSAQQLAEEAESHSECFEGGPPADRRSLRGGAECRRPSSPSQSPAGQRHDRDQAGPPPKAVFGTLLGPGDMTPSQAFPGAPGASRGMSKVGQPLPLWSFERMPSLLHGPLDRDRGKHARSCAGDPPALRAMKEAKERSAMEPQASVDSRGRPTWQSPGISQGMQQSRSEPSLLARRPEPHKCRGHQGVAGLTWDDAKVTAGGAVRGSDGRYLGY